MALEPLNLTWLRLWLVFLTFFQGLTLMDQIQISETQTGILGFLNQGIRAFFGIERLINEITISYWGGNWFFLLLLFFTFFLHGIQFKDPNVTWSSSLNDARMFFVKILLIKLSLIFYLFFTLMDRFGFNKTRLIYQYILYDSL